MVAELAGKRIVKEHLPGPTGVRGRNSDNHFIMQRIGWKPEAPLIQGLQKTYQWITAQVDKYTHTKKPGSENKLHFPA